MIMNEMMSWYIKCAQVLGYRDYRNTECQDGVVDKYYIERIYPNASDCNHLALMDTVTIDGKRNSTLNTWMIDRPKLVFEELSAFLEEAYGMQCVASAHGKNHYAVILSRDRSFGVVPEFRIISPRRNKYEMFFEVFLDFMEYANAEKKEIA